MKKKGTANILELCVYNRGFDSSTHKTLYIPIHIGDRKLNAIVDTAAQISVVKTDIINTIKPTPVLTDHINLKGIGQGSKLRARKAC